MSALAGVIALVVQLLHVALMLAAAPVLLGVLGGLQARLAGRRGPPLAQPWRELRRLARKQSVVAEQASFVAGAAPVLSFAASLLAAALVPAFAIGMTAAPLADLLVIAGLLALAQGALALAALDAGGAAGGSAVARDLTVAVCAAPALAMVLVIVTLLSGTTNLDAIATLLRNGALGLRVPLLLAVVALAMTALAVNGRLPVGARATGASDYSGRDLALLKWAGAVRLLLWLTLIATLAAPFGLADATGSALAWGFGILAWAVKLAVLALALAVFEAGAARLPVRRVPVLLGVANLLAALGVVLLVIAQGAA